jgi:hypothetical protein
MCSAQSSINRLAISTVAALRQVLSRTQLSWTHLAVSHWRTTFRLWKADQVARRCKGLAQAAHQFRQKIGAARCLRHTATQIRNAQLVERLACWQHTAAQCRSGAAHQLLTGLLCMPGLLYAGLYCVCWLILHTGLLSVLAYSVCAAIQLFNGKLRRPELREQAMSAVANWMLASIKARELRGRMRIRQVSRSS